LPANGEETAGLKGKDMNFFRHVREWRVVRRATVALGCGIGAGRKRCWQAWHYVRTILHTYRTQYLRGVGALGLIASVAIGGNQYVLFHTREIVHVYVDGQPIGTVSSVRVVEQHIAARQKELEERSPDVRLVLDREAVTFQSEKRFMGRYDNEATLAKLDETLKPKAVGVELVVGGSVVAIVRDEQVASRILEQYKQKFAKSGDVVTTFSSDGSGQASARVESVEFVQTVEVREKDIRPDQVMRPEDVLRKLEGGETTPTTYVVQEGDCVGCIAQKFGISPELIYRNNPWIRDDLIRVGDVLDLTVPKPLLSVRTVELVEERHEIPYPTEYRTDATMKAGTTKTIKPGKNGLKTIELRVTKINGEEVSEEVVGERVLEQPEPAIVVRGTRVITGEGTGRFSWPVVGYMITSTFGMRWGEMHKGIDIVGNRNILAADNGVVVFAGDRLDGYGKQVVIDHQNGYRTVYAHLSRIDVKVGQRVEKGERIGYMGATGRVTGVHLHFEIYRNGVPQNPLKYLSR